MDRNRLLFAVAAAALAAACTPSSGAADSQATPASGTPVVAFAARPDLAEGSHALPRLEGDTPQIQSINADLDRIDAGAVYEGCEVEREIRQPMTGPDFISFGISENVYCEQAAHPSFGLTGVTYDLSTGQRIDWAAAIPGLGLTQDAAEDGMPAGWIYQIRSPALARWYGEHVLAAATDAQWIEQCRPLFDPETFSENGFYLWADAAAGGVTVQPELPHVAAACGDSITLDAATLAGFDADARLLAAIATAHDAGNFVAGDG